MRELTQALKKILPSANPQSVEELAAAIEGTIKAEVQRQLAQAAKEEAEIWLSCDQG